MYIKGRTESSNKRNFGSTGTIVDGKAMVVGLQECLSAHAACHGRTMTVAKAFVGIG